MKLVVYLCKGQQLALDFTRKPVQAPGSHGGRYYRTEKTGKIRYGERPAAASASAKKWTKVDIERLKSALSGFYLKYRPLGDYGPERAEFETKFTSVMADRSNIKRAILGEMREMQGIYEDRVKQNRDTAEHYRTHLEVVGSSTQEMVDRFERYAVEAERDVRKVAALIARVEREGVPEAVTAATKES